MNQPDLKRTKSALLKAFNKHSTTIFNSFVSICRSKGDVIEKKRIGIIKQKKNFDTYDIEGVLCYDICYLYQMGYDFFAIGFNFPSSALPLDKMKVETEVHMQIFSENNREGHYACMSFPAFESKCEGYKYLSDIIKQQNVMEYHQGSTRFLTKKFFVDVVMTGLHKELERVIERFKFSEDKINTLFDSKNSYIVRRREVNRKSKAHKKSNKSKANPEIEDNNSAIRALERQIRTLKLRNAELENIKSGKQVKIDHSTELFKLKCVYESSIGAVINMLPRRRDSKLTYEICHLLF